MPVMGGGCESNCFCYPSGIFGYLITKTCLIIGNYGWCGMAALRFYDSGQLWLYFPILIWVILLYIETIVRAFYPQFRPCQCFHLCISASDMGMPCPEVLYTVGLFSYLIVFDALFGYKSLLKTKNPWFLFLSVFVCVGMYWSENYTAEQIIVSILLGALVGSLGAMFFYYQFRYSVPLIIHSSLFKGTLRYVLPTFHDEIIRVNVT
jgi:hypothetical protein